MGVSGRSPSLSLSASPLSIVRWHRPAWFSAPPPPPYLPPAPGVSLRLFHLCLLLSLSKAQSSGPPFVSGALLGKVSAPVCLSLSLSSVSESLSLSLPLSPPQPLCFPTWTLSSSGERPGAEAAGRALPARREPRARGPRSARREDAASGIARRSRPRPSV